MAKAKSKFRSRFGASCVQCNDYLVAPERSEYRDARQIVHLWRCLKCGFHFEVIIPIVATPPTEIMAKLRKILARDEFVGDGRLMRQGAALGAAYHPSRHDADGWCRHW
jgi:hypothetical protein